MFYILCALVGLLFAIICFWRRKAGAAAFAAALLSANEKDRDNFCRLAVMAGHRNACRMFCFARSDFSRTGSRSNRSSHTVSG